MKARMAVALGIAAAFGATASAETELYFDNFDGYADQAAFENGWPPFPNSAIPTTMVHPSLTLSQEQANSGTQSAKEFAVTSAQGTPASPRNRIFFTDSGLPAADNLVHFEFDFFDATGTGNPNRHYTGMFSSVAPSSSGGLVQMGTNNNLLAEADGGNYYQGRVFGYDPFLDEAGTASGNGAFFRLNGFGTDAGVGGAGIPLRSAGWHTLGVTISDTDFKFYVDDVLSRIVLRSVGFFNTTTQQIVPVTVRSFDEIRLGAGVSNNNTDAYYDNMRVVLNPDPGGPTQTGPDFNDDGFVNGEDFLIWQANYGATGTGTQPTGDASDPVDGNVNDADFALWAAQFGSPASVGAAAGIPEPASAALAAVALAGLAAVRRRRVF